MRVGCPPPAPKGRLKLAVLAIAVWGLVVLLTNPLVQAILVLLALGGFLLLLKGGPRR